MDKITNDTLERMERNQMLIIKELKIIRQDMYRRLRVASVHRFENGTYNVLNVVDVDYTSEGLVVEVR